MSAAIADLPSTGWRPRRRLWGGLALFIAGTIALTALGDWRAKHALLVNASDSLPNWAFVLNLGATPGRRDYIFFDPPPSTLLRRHFGASLHPFGKIVYGMPGDVVAHAGAIVLINGRPVARMKPLTRFGEPLTPGATGAVPQGCYFAGTPHKDGFDSRYAEIGFVCRRQIVGTGTPIL